MKIVIFYALLFLMISACNRKEQYDLIIRNGTIYNGSGKKPFIADVAVNGDKIVFMGDLKNSRGIQETDASGMAVSPGFINMLSWAHESLIEDGRSQSNIRQGVTLEVMGEGWSAGPLTEPMKKDNKEKQGNIKYDIQWTTLGENLEYLERKGVASNVASFIGATTVRIHEIGFENRTPGKQEMEAMKNLVRQAMEEGAIGLSSSLIYAPASFAGTDELVELCKAAAEYNGMYISHIRSEGDQLIEALDEFLQIADQAGIRSELYHIKAAGQENWHKMDSVIGRINSARSKGLQVTANMYNYTAAGTGLYATMPQWVQEGGHDAWVERLKNPSIRARVIQEMVAPGKNWENFYYMVGSPDKIILNGFVTDSLKYLTGKTVAEIAKLRNVTPPEVIIDMVVQDNSRVNAVYFLMTEENIEKQIKQPWVSFGSDEASQSPEGIFLKSNPHPRAYGNFSRLLGKYVREQKIISLEEAIRRLTALPASNMKIKNRGMLKEGYFADIVVFDPDVIGDHASYTNPHQYATGVKDVFVNGTQVLENGEHTGALPGRVVRGPGYNQEK